MVALEFAWSGRDVIASAVGRLETAMREEDPIRTLGWEAAKSYTSRIQAGSITASRITANCIDITPMQMAAMYPIDISTFNEPGRALILDKGVDYIGTTRARYGRRHYAECAELQTPAYRNRNA